MKNWNKEIRQRIRFREMEGRRKKEEGRRKFGNGFARADVTDVTDVRKKQEGRSKNHSSNSQGPMLFDPIINSQ
ncbi:hypothetical protein QUB56_27745 [Microcoleus sp. AR_TQ3_B6]